MTTATLHDDIATTKLGEVELEAVLDGEGATWFKVEAFKELSRRGAVSVAERGEKLLADPAAQPELRTAAAIALGKLPASASRQEALVGVLDSKQASLVTKAASALGRTGDVGAIAALEAVSVKAGHPSKAAIEFAKTLIAYRHGLSEHLLTPPAADQLLALDKKVARPMDWQPLSGAELDREATQLARQLPEISVSRKTAAKFQCGAVVYWLVCNSRFDERDIAGWLSKQSAVAAAVMRLDPCSGNHYLEEFIVANPARDGEGVLLGVRPSGIVLHSGRYTIGKDDTAFGLSATNTRYSRALELDGRLPIGGGTLSVIKAQVVAQPVKGQERPRQPAKDE